MFGFGAFSELPFSTVPVSTGPVSYTLNGSAGSYTLTGQSATFVRTRILNASAGSYTITGQAATLKEGHALGANAGSYTLTGQSASLLFSRKLTAVNGSYTYTGNAATLTRANIYTLNASNGVYSITGQAASFTTDKALTASPGAYVFTGQDATFEYVPIPVTFIPTKGGIPKAKTHVKKNEHDDIAEIVKREFDILDGTYQPEVTEKVKDVFIPQIKQIDLNEYDIAIKQVNALLLQAKNEAAKYEAKLIQDELDDEEAILMLL